MLQSVLIPMCRLRACEEDILICYKSKISFLTAQTILILTYTYTHTYRTRIPLTESARVGDVEECNLHSALLRLAIGRDPAVCMVPVPIDDQIHGVAVSA